MPIDQFRIPGRTGASFVKATKVRLMRGRNESKRAVAMANHHCFAFNCKNSTQKKKKMLKNTWNWQMLDCLHSLRAS